MDTPNSISEKRNGIISKDSINENYKNDIKLKSRWINYKDIQINAYYFKRGLVLVKPKYVSHPIEKKENFHIKDQEFYFALPEKSNGENTKLDKVNLPDAYFIEQTKNLLATLTKFVSTNNKESTPIALESDDIVLFNKKYREEIFLPLILNIHQQILGLYIYPWHSKYNANFNFSGFSQFITTSGLLGAILKGENQLEGRHILLNHNIKFYIDEKIIYIRYNSEKLNPYEQMLFSEFEKLCFLIDIFSNPNHPKQLLYHLPYYDYILFGIKLFIYGKITLDALNTLYEIILTERENYFIKINKICKEHKIRVKIESPFDNLFGSLDNQENIAVTILRTLNLPCDEISPNTDQVLCKEQENKLVQFCLLHLQTNTFNETHRQVWQDSVDNNEYGIESLEALFKVANALMLAVAAKSKNDYETCSLLPLSKKQAQDDYDTNYKSFVKTSLKEIYPYPSVFNLTIFEPLLAYSYSTEELLFYFRECRSTLSELISEKKLLQHAYANVGLFASKSKHKLIKQVSQEEKNEIEEKPIKLQQVINDSLSNNIRPIKN